MEKWPHYKSNLSNKLSLISDLRVTLYDIVQNKNPQFGPRCITAWLVGVFFSNNDFKGKQVFLIILIVKFKWKKEKEKKKDIYLTKVYILGQ